MASCGVVGVVAGTEHTCSGNRGRKSGPPRRSGRCTPTAGSAERRTLDGQAPRTSKSP